MLIKYTKQYHLYFQHGEVFSTVGLMPPFKVHLWLFIKKKIKHIHSDIDFFAHLFLQSSHDGDSNFIASLGCYSISQHCSVSVNTAMAGFILSFYFSSYPSVKNTIGLPEGDMPHMKTHFWIGWESCYVQHMQFLMDHNFCNWQWTVEAWCRVLFLWQHRAKTLIGW